MRGEDYYEKIHGEIQRGCKKYEELLAYAQGEFIVPYHSGAGMIGYYYSPVPFVK